MIKNKFILFLNLVIVFTIVLSAPSVYMQEWGGPVHTDFYIASNDPMCVDGDTWKERDGDYGVMESNSLDDCYKEDGKNWNNPHEDMEKCCPSGMMCDEDEGWECVDPTVQNGNDNGNGQNFRCSDYNQSQCGDDPWNVAYLTSNEALEDTDLGCGQSGDYGEDCQEYMNCSCVWDNDEDECIGSAENFIYHNADDGLSWSFDVLLDDDTSSEAQEECNAGEGPDVTKCTDMEYEIIDTCDEPDGHIESVMEPTWEGTGYAPDWCKNDVRRMPCLSRSLLRFIGFTSLVFALLLVALFYIWVNKKKKRKIKKE